MTNGQKDIYLSKPLWEIWTCTFHSSNHDINDSLDDMVNQKSKPKFIPSLTSEPKVKSQEANKLKQKGFPFMIS